MKKILTLGQLFITIIVFSQVGIGTPDPHTSAILDLTSTDKVFLPPRLTTAQRDSITVIPAGAMIYNLDENCMQYWDTARWKGDCTPAPLPGTIATLDCAGAVNNGTLASGTAAAGVSSIILSLIHI